MDNNKIAQTNKTESSSRLALILSMLVFGSVGIFRRLIPLASSLLAGARGFLGAIFLLAYMLISKKKIVNHIGTKKVLGLILAGAAIGFNWILLFEAYNYTSVATATLCYYMQPIILIVLSPIVFKEKLTIKKIACVIVAMVGMYFVAGVNTGSAEGSIKGVFFGLGAAALYAIVVMLNKLLAGIDAYEKTMIELLSAALVVTPYALLTEDVSGVTLSTTALVMLLIVGFIHTGLSYVMYFGSIDNLPVQSVALIGYLDPITAMILSALILHEAVTIYEIIGAVLILGATAVSELATTKD